MKKQTFSWEEKIILAAFGILLVMVIVQQAETLTQPSSEPDEIVRHYFNSWNSKDYSGMYNDISDGFKKIEKTASNITEFEKLIVSSQVKNVDIFLINVTAQNETHATVEFDVMYYFNASQAPSKSDFRMRFRPNDRVPGWKIIQPYGAKADES